MKKGFTLIELMIVVAIIAIIAAIAIPNLLQSRMQANESNAIGSLRTYAAAQSTYKKGNYSQRASTTNLAKYYCYPFSNLYGVQGTVSSGTEILALIPPPFAAATMAATGAVDQSYQGYGFADDTNLGTTVTAASSWSDEFGLFSHPSAYTKSGVNSFYVGTDATVYMCDYGNKLSTAAGGVIATPVAPVAGTGSSFNPNDSANASGQWTTP